jgi:small subunit ribosomal protein S24e
MEVIERKENPLLDRVEIRFTWNHVNSSTPSLREMVAAAAKAEPGAKQELVFVKEVSTRYGRPQTTGLALIYGSSESAALEPEYVRVRHGAESKPKAEAPAVVAPVIIEEAAKVSDENESEDGDK